MWLKCFPRIPYSSCRWPYSLQGSWSNLKVNWVGPLKVLSNSNNSVTLWFYDSVIPWSKSQSLCNSSNFLHQHCQDTTFLPVFLFNLACPSVCGAGEKSLLQHQAEPVPTAPLWYICQSFSSPRVQIFSSCFIVCPADHVGMQINFCWRSQPWGMPHQAEGQLPLLHFYGEVDTAVVRCGFSLYS